MRKAFVVCVLSVLCLAAHVARASTVFAFGQVQTAQGYATCYVNVSDDGGAPYGPFVLFMPGAGGQFACQAWAVAPDLVVMYATSGDVVRVGVLQWSGGVWQATLMEQSAGETRVLLSGPFVYGSVSVSP